MKYISLSSGTTEMLVNLNNVTNVQFDHVSKILVIRFKEKSETLTFLNKDTTKDAFEAIKEAIEI